MEKNKTGKYLKYAIGEIVLVVIGILIALQINNWNEEVKSRTIELDILNEIKLSLSRDLEDLELNLKAHNQILRSQNILVEWFKTDTTYSDSLAFHFAKINHQTEFISNDGAFETLKSMGLRSLSKDSIRISLLRIYDLRYKMYREFESYYRTNLAYIIKTINPKHFELTEDITVLKREGIGQSLKEEENLKPKISDKIINMEDVGLGFMLPKNIDLIRNDSDYMYWLKTNKNNNEKFIYFGITPLILDIKEVINTIDQELKSNL